MPIRGCKNAREIYDVTEVMLVATACRLVMMINSALRGKLKSKF